MGVTLYIAGQQHEPYGCVLYQIETSGRTGISGGIL